MVEFQRNRLPAPSGPAALAARGVQDFLLEQVTLELEGLDIGSLDQVVGEVLSSQRQPPTGEVHPGEMGCIQAEKADGLVEHLVVAPFRLYAQRLQRLSN